METKSYDKSTYSFLQKNNHRNLKGREHNVQLWAKRVERIKLKKTILKKVSKSKITQIM